MKERQQVIWGILLALLTSLIILGGVLLSLAENRFQREALTTPTNLDFKEEMPTLVFIIPVLPSQTTKATLLSTASPTLSLTPLPGCQIPAGWTTIILSNEESSEAIAVRFGISVQELAGGNCWDYPISRLLSGTSLNVPAGEMVISPTPGTWCRPQGEQACVPVLVPSSPPTHTPTKTCQKRTDWMAYTVRSGDTLYSLSKVLGVSIYAIQQANCMGNSTVLRVGQTLFVPYLPPPPPLPTRTPLPTLPPIRYPTPTPWYYPPTYTPGQPPIVLPTIGPTLPEHPPSITPMDTESPSLPVMPNPASEMPVHPPGTIAQTPLPPQPAAFTPDMGGSGSPWIKPI